MIEHSEVWAPVDSDSERERVLRGTVAENKDLLVENTQSRLQGKAVAADDFGWKVGKESRDPWPFREGDFVSVRFVFGGEDYFFKTVASFAGVELVLPVPAQIFQLQKRKHFRVVIPGDFPTAFSVLKRDRGPIPVSGPVLDINDFGLGFTCDPAKGFLVGENIEGTFRLGERPPVTVAGIVRQVGEREGRQQVGLEFRFSEIRTADQVQAAILFYRHDIFLFRKMKN